MIYGDDILQRKSFTQGHETDNGDYIPGVATWCAAELCDAQPAGKDTVYHFEGGTAKRPSYEITLDVNTRPLHTGDHIRLYKGCKGKPATAELLTGEYEVLGFQRYAFMCKAWV